MVKYSEKEEEKHSVDYYAELCRLRGVELQEPESRFVVAEDIRESGMDLPYGRRKHRAEE